MFRDNPYDLKMPQTARVDSKFSKTFICEPGQRTTARGFGLTLPNYSQQKRSKLQTYFKPAEPVFALTKVQSTLLKVKQFMRENTLSEEQTRSLERLGHSSERVTSIHKLMPRRRAQKRIARGERSRPPMYEEAATEIMHQLIKRKPNVATNIDPRRNSASKASSSVNLDGESMSRVSQVEDQQIDDQDQDQDNDPEERDTETVEINTSHAQVIYDIQRRICPKSELQKRGSYFKFIKYQDRIEDLMEHFGVNDQQNPAYFFSSHQNLFPKKIDMGSCLVDEKRLDFSNLKLGDQYLPILANFIGSKNYQSIKQLVLANNGITPKSLEMLISNVPPFVRLLDLQDNLLERQGGMLLAQCLSTRLQNIKDLNVQNNNLGDIGSQALLDSLKRSGVIKRLNLAENQLSDRIAKTMFQFISSNQSLEVLILHWNKLGSLFGTLCARALSINKGVRVLDLSYNSLGGNEDSECIQEWCILLTNQSIELNHLDLSFNSFTESQVRRLATALNKNMSIYGLHIEGNSCQAHVDPHGFIRFANEDPVVQQNHPRIDGVNYIPLKSSESINRDCCWICQGWMEFKFQYTPGESGTINSPPVFVHLDFLDYVPILMATGQEIRAEMAQSNQASTNRNLDWDLTTGEIIYQLKVLENGEKKITMASIQEAYDQNHSKDQLSDEARRDETMNHNYYALYRMCPPNRRVYYFFSNPLLSEQFIARDRQIAPKAFPACVVQFQDGTKQQLKPMDQLNFLDTKQEYILDDKNNYKPLIRVFPRTQERKYALKRLQQNQLRKKVNLIMWDVRNSIFRNFIEDTPEHLDQCFEFDWNCSKIQRFIRNDYDKQKIKEYLRDSYQLLKDIYKYYSFCNLQPLQYEVFSVPYQNFMKMILSLGVVDGELLKSTDIEIDLISIKNNLEQKYIYNPEKALIRYQFLEMFFRIANDKYIRTGVCKQYADAFQRLMKREIEPKFRYFDQNQAWRNERYWTKECDQLLRFKLPFLLKLYDFVTEITQRRWYFRLKWITLREFRDFLIRIDCFGDLISEKETMLIYNLSMATQVDELTQDRHIRMNLYEFLESLARLAEKISPCPLGQSIDKWDLVTRQTLPLHVKLETFLTYIYQSIRSIDYESYNGRFSSEDSSHSMPRPKTLKNDRGDILSTEQSKILDQIHHPIELPNKRVMSIVGVLAYNEIFKTQYIPANYKSLFTVQDAKQTQAPSGQITLRKPRQQEQQVRGRGQRRTIKFQDEM